MSDDKVPIEQVLRDMCSDGYVASAARDYYIAHYANSEEATRMKREDKIQLVGAIVFVSCVVIALIAMPLIRLLKG
jgi:hypothetical protein